MKSSTIITYIEKQLPYYLDLLQQMVAINSYTRNRDGVNRLGELTAQRFTKLGLQPEFVPSVSPEFGKHLFLQSPASLSTQRNSEGDKSIALISHLDTVFPPKEEEENDFHFRIEGDRIYGPGSVDIKGGTMLMLIVLDTLKALDPETFARINWTIACDASEETLSTDFGELCLERIPENAAACLIFEGGTPNPQALPLVTSRKGRASFLVIASGRGAHAGNFHMQGANAIRQIAETIQEISSYTNYSDQITFNVGVVSGGTVTNRVPHHAQAMVEMRAFSSSVFQRGIERMLALNGRGTVTSQDGYPCRVEVKMCSRNEPWPRNPQTEHLFQNWVEAGKQIGLKVISEERGGLSDGNSLWQRLPVLDGLGPEGANAHCSERMPDGSKDQEYALQSSIVPKALLNIAAILRLVGQPLED